MCSCIACAYVRLSRGSSATIPALTGPNTSTACQPTKVMQAFQLCPSESDSYFSFAYSDFAARRMGMSGSASFHSVKNSW
jgi:hypothetical protein